jgi:diguanylate cyclase (GGDEF)-like protein
MTIVNLLTTGSVMMFVWNVDRPGPGLKRVALGDLLLGAGLLLLVATKVVPDPAIALISYLAQLAGVISLVTGVRAFRGFSPLSTKLISSLSVSYSFAIVFLLYSQNQLTSRVVFASVFMALLSTLLAATMVSRMPEEDRPLYLFMGILFGFHAVTLLIHAAWILSHGGAQPLLLPNSTELSTLFTLNFVTTGCGFGLATASSRRLYRDTRILALHDPLTQLPNRRMLDERLAQARTPAPGSSIALVYLDLNNFKSINDTLGHQAGDEALRIFAGRLRSATRGCGFPARLGGDEFVALLESVPSRGAAFSLMESISDAVTDQMTLDGHVVSMNLSCGVAVYPGDVSCVADLVGAADAAMYRAKVGAQRFQSRPGAVLATHPNPLV